MIDNISREIGCSASLPVRPGRADRVRQPVPDVPELRRHRAGLDLPPSPLPTVREMAGAPRNLAPGNHFLVWMWIVKPSGCHCTDAFGGKHIVECRPLSGALPLSLALSWHWGGGMGWPVWLAGWLGRCEAPSRCVTLRLCALPAMPSIASARPRRRFRRSGVQHGPQADRAERIRDFKDTVYPLFESDALFLECFLLF